MQETFLEQMQASDKKLAEILSSVSEFTGSVPFFYIISFLFACLLAYFPKTCTGGLLVISELGVTFIIEKAASFVPAQLISDDYVSPYFYCV